MNIAIQQLLDHAFVISVDDFRYQLFCKRFAKYGLNCPMPRLYTGFQLKNGVYRESGLIKTKNLCNCYFTHIALVKMAQSLDWPYIVIFEDDALPCKEIVGKLSYYIDALPNDVDIFKMGHLRYIDRPTELTKDFIRVRTYGSHAYVIFKKYYQDYIDIASNKDLHVDCTCMNNPSKNIYTPKECMFIQDDNLFKSSSLHEHKQDQKFLTSTEIINKFEIL